MFHASADRLRTWLRWAEDVLGDPLDAARDDQHNFLTHPHRRPLRWERTRRGGAIAARPAHCISPVRTTGSGARRDAVAR